MLLNLHVKNLALIEEAEVEFSPGLNILTGETGAGKSILLGSVNLALGQKTSREIIRNGSDYALAELTFSVENARILDQLKQLDIVPEDSCIVISRKITDRRSICRINGETHPAGTVRRIAELLLDIHGQHEHQSLLYPQKQLEIVDFFGREEISAARSKTRDAFLQYRELKKELESCEIDEEQRIREIAFLEFEISEIEEAALLPEEDVLLEQQYRKLSNSKKIAESMNQVYILTGYDRGAGEMLGRAVREIQSVLPYDSELENLASAATDMDSLLNDFNRELSGYLSGLTFSDEDFYTLERRLDLINQLKAKYGGSLKQIAVSLEEKQERLDSLTHMQERKEELENKLRTAENNLSQASESLSRLRKKYGKELSEKIKENLKQLNFEQVAFSIQFEKSKNCTENGWDEVQYLISTNPGEPMLPLSRVVSGGELSRIMLAIKTLMADKDDVETLIFDEIDTGISGRTAQLVAEKMAQIGCSRQVICITHLPQIAAMADNHFEISKHVENQETVTRIRRLDSDESMVELARMLGGARITDTVMHNAREMKELAQVQKCTSVK